MRYVSLGSAQLARPNPKQRRGGPQNCKAACKPLVASQRQPFVGSHMVLVDPLSSHGRISRFSHGSCVSSLLVDGGWTVEAGGDRMAVQEIGWRSQSCPWGEGRTCKGAIPPASALGREGSRAHPHPSPLNFGESSRRPATIPSSWNLRMRQDVLFQRSRTCRRQQGGWGEAQGRRTRRPCHRTVVHRS